jgi:hypothetical protein
MKPNQFLGLLADTYRQMLFEQEIPAPGPSPTPAAPQNTPPPVPPQTPPPNGDTPGNVEEPKKELGGAVTQEDEALLARLLAKAFFLDVTDGAERYQIKNMQSNLNDETAQQVEFELVKKVMALDPQLLDIDEDLFELTPGEARIFINKLMEKKMIPDLEIKPGGSKPYMLNLIITALLRPTDLNLVKVEELLKSIKEKSSSESKTVSEQSRFLDLLQTTISKYAKF